MTGIYKITSPTGKVYIGQSRSIKNRWTSYRCTKGKGQPKLNHSFNKYGVSEHIFEVIHIFDDNIDQEILNLFEQLDCIIEIQRGIELMNLRQPGSYGKHSISTKNKISQLQKGNKSNLGRILSEETKRLMSEAKKGKIGKSPSIETRAKISKAKKGKPLSEIAKKHMSKPKSKIGKFNIAMGQKLRRIRENHKKE